MGKIRKTIVYALLAFMACAGTLYGIGSLLIKPARHVITADLTGLSVEPVSFPSLSGRLLKGWFITGTRSEGIVLMHGVRGNRVHMLQRARLLNEHGYNVLLFDFQAHGESSGDYITFGYLESRDAQAAIRFMRAQKHMKKVGALGTSMGAAAIILADGAQADAIVAEASYTDIRQAIDNRLRERAGAFAVYCEPLLLNQLQWRLGINPDELSPLNHIAMIHVPILIIAGEKDLLAPLSGAEQLYAKANEPKTLWVAKNAGHHDFMLKMSKEYDTKILDFFSSALN